MMMTGAGVLKAPEREQRAHVRRLPQYMAVYVGICAGFLQLLDIAIQRFAVADRYFTIGLIATMVGLPVVIGAGLVREIAARESARTSRRSGGRIMPWIGGVTVVAVAVLGARAAAQWYEPRQAEGAARRVLLAELETRTGGDTMAQVVRDVFAVDLENEPAVQLIDRAAVAQEMALDGIDPATPLSASHAHRLARRLNAAGVVAGEIERTGESFLIIARMFDAHGGRIASARETAADAGELWSAVDRLSQRIRTAAAQLSAPAGGEDQAYPTLQPELLALHADGVRAAAAGDASRAELQFRQVLASQPDFLPALRALGEVLYERGDSAAGRPVLEEAREIAQREHGRERYLALAAYYANVEANPARASISYRRILETDPEDEAARIRLARTRRVNDGG